MLGSPTIYNGLNGTNYQNEENLEIYTLENAVYMGVKNDVSFLLMSELNLYEHQASQNPNMPLRDLLYIARQYEKYVMRKSLYSGRLLKIPTPKFVVFYNGTNTEPIAEAVDHAVTECIREGVLRDFLQAQRAEVVAMSIFEYGRDEILFFMQTLLSSDRKDEIEQAVTDKALLDEFGLVFDQPSEKIP